MSIDWVSLIKDAESDLAKALTARVVAGVVARVPWLGSVSGPLSFLISILIGQLVKYGDWLAYHLGNAWENTEKGKVYQEAGEALDNLPPEATEEEKSAARKAKADAFDKLMGASGN